MNKSRNEEYRSPLSKEDHYKIAKSAMNTAWTALNKARDEVKTLKLAYDEAISMAEKAYDKIKNN